MNKKIFTLTVSMFLILLVGHLSDVSACSCWKEASVCDEFGSVKAVFVGEVVEGNSGNRMSETLKMKENKPTFKFKVLQNFLGTKEDELTTIRTGFGGGDCGFPFRKGERYLVYAYGKEDGTLSTGICSRTRHISVADDDLEELKYLMLGSGAKIYGKVTQYLKSRAIDDAEQLASKMKLEITQIGGENKIYQAETDSKGKYELKNIPSGSYKIRPLLGVGWLVSEYELKEFSVNEKGCSERNFFVKSQSSVRGKVTNFVGDLIDGQVDLIPVDVLNPHVGEYSLIDDRNFEIENVPPGKYRVAFNYYSGPSESSPYPRTFYKAAGETGDSTVIEVKLGESVENLVIKLPPKLPMTEIKGKVLWKNGKPAPNVSVGLRDFEGRNNVSDGETDAEGNFTINGFEGRKYILETYLEINEKGESATFEAKDVIFTLDKNTTAFKLILEKRKEEE